MRRNSGYTWSASRSRAAGSPTLQAFNRFVISAEDTSKKYYRRGRFCRSISPAPVEGTKFAYENHNENEYLPADGGDDSDSGACSPGGGTEASTLQRYDAGD